MTKYAAPNVMSSSHDDSGHDIGAGGERLDMIRVLVDYLPVIYGDLDGVNGWESLVINRRKPWTYRVFRKYGNFRVCLHAFDPCENSEAFAHPHPWPGAFLMLKGAYIHSLGASVDLKSKPDFFERAIITPYSMYEIINPRTWHSVQPLERTYTIMVNGEPWGNPHKDVKTTKGKDLDKMSPEDLIIHLGEFKDLLRDALAIKNLFGEIK